MSVNSSTSGRISAEEIKQKIEEACRMRETDNIEQDRLDARGDLEGYCIYMQRKLRRNEKVMVRECLQWIR